MCTPCSSSFLVGRWWPLSPSRLTRRRNSTTPAGCEGSRLIERPGAGGPASGETIKFSLNVKPAGRLHKRGTCKHSVLSLSLSLESATWSRARWLQVPPNSRLLTGAESQLRQAGEAAAVSALSSPPAVAGAAAAAAPHQRVVAAFGRKVPPVLARSGAPTPGKETFQVPFESFNGPSWRVHAPWSE
jgi:hypothetical protein